MVMIKQLDEKMKSIPKEYIVTFICTMVFGSLAHYYAFTNKITNHDDIRTTCAEMNEVRWGRWLLAYASDLSGNISMPFNCLLGLIFIAFSAAFVVAILNIKSTILSGIVGGIMGTFPTITFNNLYAATADCYPLAILFMVVATYIAVRSRKLWVSIIGPAILMTLSQGIYQAYMGIALGLMIIVGIVELIYEKSDFKTVLLKEIRFLGTSVLGIIMYLLTSKIICRILGVEMDSYQNMDNMGSIDLAELPLQIRHSYTKTLGYYLWNVRGVHYKWLSVTLVIVAVATLAFLVTVVIKNRVEKLELALVIVLMMLLPMASGYIYITGADHIHLLVIYSFICIPLLTIVVMDKLSSEKSICVNLFEGFGIFVFAAVVYNYITLANTVYMIDYYTYEESYSWAQTVSTVIRTTPGYDIDSKIYMIGLPKSKAIAVDEFYDDDPRTAEFDGTGLRRDFNAEYSKNGFYWYFLGLTNTIKDIDMDDATEMGIGDIEVFPSKNSVKQIDGDIIIRFE